MIERRHPHVHQDGRQTSAAPIEITLSLSGTALSCATINVDIYNTLTLASKAKLTIASVISFFSSNTDSFFSPRVCTLPEPARPFRPSELRSELLVLGALCASFFLHSGFQTENGSGGY